MIDVIEITLFMLAYYTINSWLYNQEHKQLLMSWYAYHLLLMTAYVAQLQALFFVAACCFPLVLALMIIFHERRLQTMFVVAQRLHPLTTTTAASCWQDELIKFALMRLNEHKELWVVIEQHDSLAPLICARQLVQADIRKHTLELLYDSFSTPKESFLWITNAGKIISLAATWAQWSCDEAIQVTHATDCIMLKSCVVTRSFTLVINTQSIEQLSAHHALNMLHELTSPSYQKGNTYGTQRTFEPYQDTHFS